MRWVLAVLVTLIASKAGPTISMSPEIDVKEVYIRWAVHRHALIPDVEYLMRAQLRLENGGPCYEAGMKTPEHPEKPMGDAGAYVDLTMPGVGAVQYSRLSRRMLLSMQKWIMEDPYRRREWMKRYTEAYHAGTKEENQTYCTDLYGIWLQERAKGRQKAIMGVEGRNGK